MTADVARLTAGLADRYRLERELGQGGMATVFLAHDLKHDRKVALKVLRPELAAVLGAERFLREITTTANLRHPHILPLYDSGSVPGDGSTEVLFYVMPYVEGESLRDRLSRERQLPLDDALQIARQVADALSYAHSRGVIHRDIKPENVLLEHGHAVVADFGIARAVDAAGGTQLTETGLAVGTPTYMSPEQAAGEGDLDGRSDLYALACVLYEMLGGQPPFTGPTVESVIRQHLVAEAPPITNLRPAVPAPVVAALQRALAKLPADRFNPVAQFSDTLRFPTAPADGPAAAAPPRAARAPASPRRRGRRWIGVTVASLGGVVVLTAIGFAVLRNDATRDTRYTSLAVLPFENIGGDPETEYFSEGITEDITARVSQIAGIRVISRTSTAQFKGSTASVRDVATQLGVSTVLEGSVRRAGSRVRVVAQLIDARTDEHLWANTYDRDLADIFAIQSDIAQNIGNALGAVLAKGSDAPTVPTSNLAAYDLYLQGRLLWNQRTEDALRAALDRFEAALALDPHFAEAVAALAETWILMPVYARTPSLDAMANVERYADSALALNPRLPGPHAARGFARALIAWDWAGGEQSLREAIRLNPSFATAHQWLANVIWLRRQSDEAFGEHNLAQGLDPLSSIIPTDKAMLLTAARRYDEAERGFRSVIERNPRFAEAFRRQSWLYALTGRDSVSAESLEQWNVLQGRPLFPPGDVRSAFRRGGAAAMYGLLVEAGSGGRALTLDVAFWYLRLGENVRALDLLEEAAERHDIWLSVHIANGLFGALEHEPRYQAVVQRVFGR